MHLNPRLSRRSLLHAGTAFLGLHFSAGAQPLAAHAALPSITVAQVVDLSPHLQDVARDFLVGSQAGWQSLNAHGGVGGRQVRHLIFTTDGSAPSARDAWQRIQAADQCVVLSGCVGDAATQAMAELQARHSVGASLAQVAPWVQANDVPPPGSNIFGIFPGYQEQMAHALKALATVGVREIGVAFPSAAHHARSYRAAERAATALGVQLRLFPVPGQPTGGSEREAEQTQAIVLFLGGTPELHAFARRLPAQPGGRRYIVTLADVNLQVLAQMGGLPRHSSVIATQAVPLLTSSLGVVRTYQKAMKHLYDEPPSPQGLAGFIAARYTAAVLSSVRGDVTRNSVLQALRSRSDIDVEGFVVRSAGQERGNAYVTQTMLAADGRLIG